MCGCFGSGGREGSDDIDVTLRPWAFQTLIFGFCNDVCDRDLVETGFDSSRQIFEDDFGHAPRVARRLSAARTGLAIAQADGPFEGAHDVTQTDVHGSARQAVATLRPALRAHDAGPLQVLEDLLEEAWRDVLALGDVLDLSRTALVIEGDIEQRAHGIAALVRQLHVLDMHWHIVFVKNAPGGIWACFWGREASRE